MKTFVITSSADWTYVIHGDYLRRVGDFVEVCNRGTEILDSAILVAAFYQPKAAHEQTAQPQEVAA